MPYVRSGAFTAVILKGVIVYSVTSWKLTYISAEISASIFKVKSKPRCKAAS